MLANRFSQVVDTLCVMKDAGLVAASAAAQVSGSAKVFDVNGNGAAGVLSPTAGMQTAALFSGVMLIDVTALEIDSSNEIYDIVVQGSPDANFGTAGNIVELAQLSLGHKTPKRTDSDKDDSVGRYFLPFVNLRDDVTFRYLRLYTVVGGTIATGINYSAHLARMNFGIV